MTRCVGARSGSKTWPATFPAWFINSDGAFSFPYVSPTIEEVIGVTAEAVEADPSVWFGLIHPNDIDRLRAAINTSHSSLSPWDWTGRLITPEGGIRWFHGASIPRVMEDDSTVWNGLVLDITENVAARRTRTGG